MSTNFGNDQGTASAQDGTINLIVVYAIPG